MTDGIVGVDRKAGSILAVECELPATSWVIATRGAVPQAELESLGVPADFAAAAAWSSEECNWHVTEDRAPTDASPNDRKRLFWCEELPLQVSSLVAIKSRKFTAMLARDSDGGVHLLRLFAVP